ncbi:MAG TPA: ABC-2 family transporter protein [Anaeromyxobacter sp.]|nr:ABC-2 family transporter protein [Anaeromyxobacter sp.]
MTRALRALPTLLRIGFADAVAYRAELVVWLLSTNMALVMMALLTAVAREAPVGRFGERDFVAYYLATLVVRLLTGAWVVWEANMEIRQGTLAFRLLRPIHPLVHYAAENLAAVPLRGAIALPIAVLLLVTVGGERVTHDPVLWIVFAVAVAGAWLITFLAMAVIAALAFYVDSATSVAQVWFGLFTVLSGYIMPLEIFPRFIGEAARWLPFRYMLAFPVELVIGLTPRPRALLDLGIQWLFVVVLALSARFAWRVGLRRYSAFGG